MDFFIRYTLFFSFLLSSLMSFAQFDDKKFDKESFLIGMLNEYMGYQRTFTNGDNFYYQRVDIMGKDELKKALFIDSLFSLDYPDITIVNNGAPMGIKLYSPTLSKKIDTYYDYKPNGIRTLQGDTVYSGSLKKGIFVTEKQKLSFLLATYMRYGGDKYITNSRLQFFENNDCLEVVRKYENVSFSFSLSNAPSKAQMCVEILKDLGCTDMEYVVLKDYIPVGHHVIFIPSPKIQEMVDDAIALRRYIDTIGTDHVEFTAEGVKFVWDEPEPYRPKREETMNNNDGSTVTVEFGKRRDRDKTSGTDSVTVVAELTDEQLQQLRVKDSNYFFKDSYKRKGKR